MSRIFSKSLAHAKKAHALIPGGAHTYSKGDDQYPETMLPYIARGQGCHVWDIDGNEFLEYGAGLRAVTLGHAYGPVVDAACQAMHHGANFARPAKIELDAAEAFLGLIDSADMVKFAKHGSDCTTAAVKLARAFTGRDRVGICSDHPFYSTDDWFIGVTPMNAGIPKAICDLTLAFRYNNLDSAQSLFNQYPGQIACLMLEAETQEPPRDGYLQNLLDLCHRNGALLIFDETITGFRWHTGGAQKMFGVRPDLSTFGKAMANGFAVSALCGKREIMTLGGINHDRERVFLLSTTHGAETHSLAAHVATIAAYKERDIPALLDKQGRRLRDGVNAVAKSVGIDQYFFATGKPCCLIFATCDEKKQRSQPFRTLFLQELLRRGVLAPNLIVNAAHTDADIDRTIEIISEALVIYKRALEEGVEKYLVGRPVKPVFRKMC